MMENSICVYLRYKFCAFFSDGTLLNTSLSNWILKITIFDRFYGFRVTLVYGFTNTVGVHPFDDIWIWILLNFKKNCKWRLSILLLHLTRNSRKKLQNQYLRLYQCHKKLYNLHNLIIKWFGTRFMLD